MKLDSEGAANGWWAKAGEEESCPWQWSPSDQELGQTEPLKGAETDEHVIQTAAPARLRPSLSSRVNRGLSFFDEMLEAEGSSSVMIARWGVFCAWIFFWQTLSALIMASLQTTGDAPSMVQCFFQAVYTATYASFLVIYTQMRVMPPLDYVAGVFLYTIGYACFLVLYALSLAMEASDEVAQTSQYLYVAGSLLFLAGSAVLVRATMPPPVPMVFRKLTFMEQMRAQYSLFDQQSSLFWGSMMFLLGSILFSVDATWSLLAPEFKPELLSVTCIAMGYAHFTVGRVYFLWGSTTADCDALLRGAGWGYSWCYMCLPCKRQSVQVAPQDESSPKPRFSVPSLTSLSANSDEMVEVVASPSKMSHESAASKYAEP